VHALSLSHSSPRLPSLALPGPNGRRRHASSRDCHTALVVSSAYQHTLACPGKGPREATQTLHIFTRASICLACLVCASDSSRRLIPRPSAFQRDTTPTCLPPGRDPPETSCSWQTFTVSRFRVALSHSATHCRETLLEPVVGDTHVTHTPTTTHGSTHHTTTTATLGAHAIRLILTGLPGYARYTHQPFRRHCTLACYCCCDV
jgi:hypothetical protein